MKNGDLVVETIGYEPFSSAQKMRVSVREYPAGALLEFDLSVDGREKVLKIIGEEAAQKLFKLTKAAGL